MHLEQGDNISPSVIKLNQVLQIFAVTWAAENNTTLRWMEYTAQGVQSKLRGLLGNHRLWQEGARGLSRVNEQGDHIPLTDNDALNEAVHLRGTVVICCHKKVTRPNQGTHYKHAIHINDVIQYLQERASLDLSLAPILEQYSVGGPEKLDVFFNPFLLNEEQPPSTADEIAPQLKHHLNEYISLTDAQLKNVDIQLAHNQEFFNLIDQLEDYKTVHSLSSEQIILYYISLAFCASLMEAEDLANEAMTNPELIEALGYSQDVVHHYYCLSVIAMKIKNPELSKIFDEKSFQGLTGENSAKVEAGNFSTQKGILFQSASGQNRLSIKSLRIPGLAVNTRQ